ncbi:MAG: zinc-ribbon domain-containing protein [Elusimicrobia bacterium]|nr:zinc-ribbon domain-containing protein [Candidatus Obscuribacterium magneticum]
MSPAKGSPGDRLLRCIDCNTEFVFDEGEQHFFRSKGFTDPKRCPRCRKRMKDRTKRRGRFQRFFRGGRPRRHNGRREESPYVDD